MENYLKRFRKNGAHPLFFICLIFSAILFDRCKNQTACPACSAAPPVTPNVNLSFIGKDSGQSLFFVYGSPYTSNQIKANHLVNGKPGNVIITIDSLNKIFNIAINSQSNLDTVILQIGNLPADILLFSTSAMGTCCPVKTLNTVTFNGTSIFPYLNQTNYSIIKK